MVYSCPFFGGGNMYGGLLWIVLIGGIIWLIIWLNKGGSVMETPGQIAEKRYAKGEITKKQFEEIKKGLRS